jgi:hypothetical protein
MLENPLVNSAVHSPLAVGPLDEVQAQGSESIQYGVTDRSCSVVIHLSAAQSQVPPHEPKPKQFIFPAGEKAALLRAT